MVGYDFQMKPIEQARGEPVTITQVKFVRRIEGSN